MLPAKFVKLVFASHLDAVDRRQKRSNAQRRKLPGGLGIENHFGIQRRNQDINRIRTMDFTNALQKNLHAGRGIGD